MKIGFDVALSVSFTVSERDYHFDDYDDHTIWLIPQCEGDIEKKLDDFLFLETSLYAKWNRTLRDLDDSLVPYIASESLEIEAENFLKQYYPRLFE